MQKLVFMVNQWQQQLRNVANPQKVKILSSFFKTGKGEYGEGDIFIGIVVPDNRRIARQYRNAPIEVIRQMLYSEIHEFRASAIFALVDRYTHEKDSNARQAIVDFYLANASQCNNWDLVDLSAPYILGNHMLEHPMPLLLDKLSNDRNLWLQRIAIVATLMLIRHNRFDDTLRLSQHYLSHPHPLIHKATGWMLREIGKRDQKTLLGFLDANATKMPRTALRYAIERLTPQQRQYFLSLK